MRNETPKAFRNGQTKVKSTTKSIQKEVSPSWMEKQLLKIYLKSPQKLQYALAKYGAKHAIKKKKVALEQILKH